MKNTSKLFMIIAFMALIMVSEVNNTIVMTIIDQNTLRFDELDMIFIKKK